MEPKEINCTSIINSSFNSFLIQHQIVYPNLTRDHLNKWDFEKYLQEKEGITFTEEQICSIPPLNIKSLSIKPSLVKFCGIIQNVLENQLYLCTKYNQSKKTFEVNKYYEAPIFQSEQTQGQNDEEDLGCCDANDESSILCDRLVLNVIPIPGLIKQFKNEFEYDENLKDKRILVYDYTNSFSKVNEEILTIGVAYMKENEIVIHSWKTIPNYIPSKLQHTISLKQEEILLIRKDILKALMEQCLFNDGLSAEYVLMFFMSQIFARYGTKNIGTFPINLILSHQTKGAIEKLAALMKAICLFVTEIDVTIDSLNKTPFYPRFDSEKDELVTGILQLNSKAFLLLNEYNLNEGKLEQIGIKNVNSIKNLIDFQVIQYEYPYNAIEIPHDCEVISFTQNQKSLFFSPFMTIIPLTNEWNSKDNGNIEMKGKDTQDTLTYFNYINYLRYSDAFASNFTLEDQLSNKIQADYISKYKNFNPDDFDRCLKLCRLYAISKGQTKFLFEDYLFIVDLESKRFQRLDVLFTKK